MILLNDDDIESNILKQLVKKLTEMQFFIVKDYQSERTLIQSLCKAMKVRGLRECHIWFGNLVKRLVHGPQLGCPSPSTKKN